MVKKYLLAFLCLMVVSSLWGCQRETKKTEVESEVTETQIIEDSSKQMLVAVNVDNSTSTLPFASVLMNRSQFWGGLVFQGLLISEESINNVQLDLCQEYNVAPNGKTYIFVLKEELYWHDGEPLTTKDVLWSIETCLSSQEVNGFIKKGLQTIIGAKEFEAGVVDYIEGIEITDKEIIIKLEEINSDFLATIAQVPVLPEHCFEDSENRDISQSSFWQMPVGSGPYKVVKNIDNKDALLVINELYSGKKPKIQQIRYKVLENPGVDDFDFTITSDPDVITWYKVNSSYEVIRTNNLYYRYLFLNVDGKDKNNKGNFDDARVRQALVLGLDREKIINEIYGGVALNIDCGIPSTDSWYVRKDVEKTAYRPQKAKQLLEEAGFDFDSTLVLTRYHEDERSVKLLESVAEDWRELGIQVEMQPITNKETNKLWVDTDWYDVGLKNLAAVDYDEWYFEYASDNQMWSVVLNNRTEFDDLILQLSNAKWVHERERLYEEIQKLEIEHSFKIPLAILPQYIIYNKDRLSIPDISFPNLWYYFDVSISQWEIIK